MNEVWYVHGDPYAVDRWPTLFATKLAAEAYARECFPDEDPDKRYARVMYREVNN